MKIKINFLQYYIDFFTFLFVLFAFSGLVAGSKYNLLPAAKVFEILIVGLFILNIRKINYKVMVFAIISAIYILYNFIFGVMLGDIHILDFLLAYKAYIYIIFLSFFVGKNFIKTELFFKLLRFILIMMFVKYFYCVVFSINLRPGIFTENNFELMFILILFYLEYILLLNKINFLNTFLLVGIFILSDSRSGIISLAFLFFMIYAFKLDRKILIRILFVLLIFVFAIFVFLERGQSILETDRFGFFMFFLYDIRDWNIVNFLFGSSGALVPLSDFTCNGLSYYSSLFSYSGDGSCYSVVYHSYILRALYDHGFIGLIFICIFYLYILKLSKFSIWQCLTILGVILLNSFSVSAFNNIFIIIAIIIVLGVNINDRFIKKSTK